MAWYDADGVLGRVVVSGFWLLAVATAVVALAAIVPLEGRWKWVVVGVLAMSYGWYVWRKIHREMREESRMTERGHTRNR